MIRLWMCESYTPEVLKKGSIAWKTRNLLGWTRYWPNKSYTSILCSKLLHRLLNKSQKNGANQKWSPFSRPRGTEQIPVVPPVQAVRTPYRLDRIQCHLAPYRLCQSNGLPCGSVVSSLFDIYTNDQPIHFQAEHFIYADDFGIAV